MGRPAINLEGKRFGRLMATNKLRKTRYGIGRERLCICDCGNEVWIQTNKFISGHTQSCGCWLMDFKRIGSGKAARNEVLYDYQYGAERRGLDWQLTDEDFDLITSLDCFYCGSKPSNIKITHRNGSRSNRKDSGDFVYNGIDRKDNTKGYLLSNVVPCCKICNRAKSDMNFDDFMAWIEKVRENVHESQN